ncbi:glyoxylase-like metal-dependent hydrolase (beta-lactamase superfamily II) [Altererythrobacter atlanticus]|uniref:Carbapenem-hydrolyzing beta-lactamase BlaB-1 n=1 Tax=Croceibacterium atlanticum TaxID=1267766 RepID=A0A0F7KTY3_9SPHN|nr:MBL fold metallo-hydrolase [Croceibacterium atlanticum]AKH42621.1 Carbapenem-hydrolyzing beta-lactamase BlaB-1 precursor [Croceibacterium atlanticum]MBB5731398.1 glyoxylase-like metal-dependent hydrolase (beta-lactamase superfamily II) [Croceibacterium atlanticum]
MKRIAILGAIVVAGMTAAGVSAQGGLPGIEPIEQVSDNVYKIFGAGGNTVVFVRSDGVTLVDTKLPGNGQAILDQVRKVTDKPVTMIVNTHSHPDHMGSNTELEDLAGHVEVIAHANSSARMAELPNARRPDRSFDDRMTIGSGKDEINLYYFGAGHTDGDAFVVFPAERTMAAGDIMAWYMAPLIDPASGGSMLATPVTLGKAQDTIKGVDKVIEGHGQVRSWDEFRAYITFHRALVDAAEKTLADGGTPEDALAALESNPGFKPFLGEELMKGLEYGGTPKSRALIGLNVAFQELKGEPVTTQWGPRPPAGPPPQ